MSIIKIQPQYIQGISNQDLSHIISKLVTVSNGIRTVKTGIDGKILSSRNIAGRLNEAVVELDKLESQLQQLKHVMNFSVNKYSSAESKLISTAKTITSRSHLNVGSTTIGRNLQSLRLSGYQFGSLDESYTGFGPFLPYQMRMQMGGLHTTAPYQPYLQNGPYVYNQNINHPMGVPLGQYGIGPIPYGQPQSVSQVNNSSPNEGYWKGEGILLGDKVKQPDSNLTAFGGLGSYSYNWADSDGLINGHGQIGGDAKFSGIGGGLEWDGSIIDAKGTIDMGQVGGTLRVGGDSLLPIIKAEGKVLGYEGKINLDENIPFAGDSGIGGKADILTANANIGFENDTVGLGAKAALAEAEGNVYIHIPWTDYELKLIAGASAGSVGGEIRVGTENFIDLRAVIGVKLGFGFEKQDENPGI